jgi:putative transposase
MPDYRRSYIPGGTFFFTVVTEGRSRWLCEDMARDCLRAAIRGCRRRRPFSLDAMVLLPDHLHAIWTLPPGDIDYSGRWAWIKREFTRLWLASGGPETEVGPGRRDQRRRGVWQPRYWEHTIRDEDDLERHVEYIHFNPVKHGLCRYPSDWPFSSFHRYVRAGHYPAEWGCQGEKGGAMDFAAIEPFGGE